MPNVGALYPRVLRKWCNGCTYVNQTLGYSSILYFRSVFYIVDSRTFSGPVVCEDSWR
nr:MAG TPA: hypothetical protein [Caudoviricetes sp.]